MEDVKVIVHPSQLSPYSEVDIVLVLYLKALNRNLCRKMLSDKLLEKSDFNVDRETAVSEL